MPLRRELAAQDLIVCRQDFRDGSTIIAIVRFAFSTLIRGAGCLTLVCFFCLLALLAHVIFLRTDGRLLALCNHGDWPCLLDKYGQGSTGWDGS